MKFTQQSLLHLVAALACVAGAHAQSSLLWNQVSDGQSVYGPALLSSNPSFDTEIADDFDLHADITRVTIYSYSTTPSTFQGMYVRFYGVAVDGKPGLLQQQLFFGPADPNVTHDALLSTIDIQFHAPFHAAGRTFVAFQEVQNPIYNPSANTDHPTMATFFYRDNQGTDGWVHHDMLMVGYFNADLGFKLYGTVTTPPQLTGISASQAARSGRLLLTGSGFDGTQGSSRVTVGGLDAIVTRWSNTSIHCYVPEACPLGPVSVQVVTATGTSAPLPLDVTTRQAQGHARWRFELDSDYTYSRAEVAPDGSVYVNDIDGLLYKLSSNGALLWIRFTGPLGQTIGCEGPVAVGADGNVYVANLLAGVSANILSYAPDGTLRWSFADPMGQGVIAGPAVGPDGNIYFVTDFTGRGATALSPNGQMLWSNVGNPQIDENGQTGEEIAFGPAQIGGSGASRMYAAFDDYSMSVRNQLYAFDMTGGSQHFAVDTGAQSTILSQRQGQPVVGPNGQVLLCSSWFAAGWALSAFDPSNGAVLWNYFPWPHNGLTEPVVGPDGAVYISHSASYLACVNPDGTERWSHLDANVLYDAVVIAPDGANLVVAGQSTVTYQSLVRGYDASGVLKWNFDLGTEGVSNLAASTRARFSHDGSTAYLGVWLAPADSVDPHAWFYAFDVRLEPGTAYCFGDGTGAACPCANNGALGNGCANSVDPAGGNLAVNGLPSVSNDSIVLTGSGMPNSTALFFQGTAQVSSAFGDGLRCAGGALLRLGIQLNAGGASSYPGPGDLAVSVRGLDAAGNARTYQVWYRNANPTYCTPSTFNLSNGYALTWVP